MFRKLALKSAVWHEPDLEFEWDPEAGAVRGRDADKVLEMAQAALDHGEVTSHPHPTGYDITDPIRKPRELAAILGRFWILPEDLAALLQPEPEPDAGEIFDVEPLE